MESGEEFCGQLPPDKVGRREYDVIITGAGPAGAMAAIHLSRRGYGVLMIDRAWFPREKICGDGLLADSLRCLAEVDLMGEVEARANRVGEAVVYSPSGAGLTLFGPFYVMKRKYLDAMVARRAVECGAMFMRAGVSELKVADSGIVECRIKGSDEVFNARAAIVATGINLSPLKKLDMVERAAHSALAYRFYVKSCAETENMVMALPGRPAPAYVWAFPLGGGEYNMGGGVFFRRGNRQLSRGEMIGELERYLETFPRTAELLEKSESRTRTEVSYLRTGLAGAAPVRGPVLAAGDAIGSTLPATGEGVGKAMETGVIAAGVIHEAFSAGDMELLSRYPAELERKLRPVFRSYATAETLITKPWFVNTIAGLARSNRAMQESASRMITEEKSVMRIFRPGTIARWFRKK